VEDKYFKNDDVDIQKNQFNGDKDQDQILYNNFKYYINYTKKLPKFLNLLKCLFYY
jgi:hypothetical protein